MRVDDPCPTCEEFGVCGGRCLFANKQKFWGAEEFEKVCDITRHLINELKRHVPTVQELVDAGRITIEDFNYPEFNNGCEIIP